MLWLNKNWYSCSGIREFYEENYPLYHGITNVSPHITLYTSNYYNYYDDSTCHLTMCSSNYNHTIHMYLSTIHEYLTNFYQFCSPPYECLYGLLTDVSPMESERVACTCACNSNRMFRFFMKISIHTTPKDLSQRQACKTPKSIILTASSHLTSVLYTNWCTVRCRLMSVTISIKLFAGLTKTECVSPDIMSQTIFSHFRNVMLPTSRSRVVLNCLKQRNE